MLSGGALLGAVQVGVLKVLFQAGFQPSLVVGTSVGALNGAFIAFHPGADGTTQLERVWRDLRASRIYERNPFRMAATLLSRGNCVFGNDLLRDLVHQSLPSDDFAAAQVPLYVVATNLTKGEKVVFHQGSVSEAVLASTAIPGIFCPVERDGAILVDGAIVAHLDLETAVELGAKEILAIDLSPPSSGFRIQNITGVLNRSLDLLIHEQVRREVARFSSKARITVIRPRLEHAHTLSSFSHVSHLIEEGERLGRQLLESCLDGRGRLRCGVVTNVA